MAATGEWRDEVCSLLDHAIVDSARISTYTKAAQTLLVSGSCSMTSVVKLCSRLVQISDSSCATSSKTASM